MTDEAGRERRFYGSLHDISRDKLAASWISQIRFTVYLNAVSSSATSHVCVTHYEASEAKKRCVMQNGFQPWDVAVSAACTDQESDNRHQRRADLVHK